eukprot:TRINITY_DN9569_c0_g1_i1.p1 TRINITY_DN9569_c0_g1~~TRINITY_DN9569_c0_g1_i1.p1  ORF type:complete len:446 (+),score=106.14 TRINITY_DN9569_c0_g1_i1:67-1404(+)
MVFQTITHNAVSYFLEHYFEEWVEGLHRLDCSEFPLTLRNLKIKEQKIKEEMDDDGAFEFAGGTIGSVRMNMSWSGEVEVVADQVRLNFSFHPMKWMRKKWYPEEAEDAEEDDENQVPLDVQKKLSQVPPGAGNASQQAGLAAAAAAAAAVPPRFCHLHDSSDKRTKGEPHSFECGSCGQTVKTNYVESALCPACSDREKRCMCCGGPADGQPGVAPGQMPPPGGPPQTAPQGYLSAAGAPAQTAPPGGAATPVFCAHHSTSEQRPKVEPVLRECRNCPSCSERENKCMLCAAPAAEGAGPLQRQEMPPPVYASHMPPAEQVEAAEAVGRRIAVDSNAGGGKGGGKGGRSSHLDSLPPPPPPLPKQGMRASFPASSPGPASPSSRTRMLPSTGLPSAQSNSLAAGFGNPMASGYQNPMASGYQHPLASGSQMQAPPSGWPPSRQF